MKKKKILVSFVFCFILLSAVFLGKGEAKAAGNYYIQINKATNVVTVFRSNGTPDRAFVCSTGSATPIGTFYTSQKLRWHVLDGPSYGQYCTRIVNGILFHSVWYYGNGDYASQSYVQYNKLGTTASHGCVRLTVADAKWIYENCPLQTKVTVIYGSSANDPLGKPEAIKIPAKYGSRGWDPTDPMSGNPYSSLRPSVNVAGAQTQMEYGAAFNAYAGISAQDSLGNDITSRLSSSGSVNTKRLGSYPVTYTVTDALGRSASAEVVYHVVDSQKAVIKGVKKSQTKEYNSTFKLKSKVKAYTVDKKNLSKKITVKIVYPKGKKEKLYKKSSIKLNKLGTYKINYYVTNPNNKLVTKATSKIVVKDTKIPKLSGVSAKKTLEYNSVKNLRSGVKAKLSSGKNLTSKIVVKVKAPGSSKYRKLSASKSKSYKFSKTGTYRVEYSVTNPSNKKAVAKKETVYTINDTSRPILSGVQAKQTIEYNTVRNLMTGVSSKLASGQNLTSKVVVKVRIPGAKNFQTLNAAAYRQYRFGKTGVYAVEYSIANPNNAKAIAKSTMTVTVNDTNAPVISGVKNRTAVQGDSMNLRTGVKAALLSGTDVTAKLQITVTAPGGQPQNWTGQTYVFEKAGNYTVLYKAANPVSGKTSQASMTVTVAAVQPPQIIIDRNKAAQALVGTPYNVYDKVMATLPNNQGQAKLTAVIEGVDAAGQKITAIPQIGQDGNVTFTVAGTYTITYKAENPANSAQFATETFVLDVKAADAGAEDKKDEKAESEDAEQPKEQPEADALTQEQQEGQPETDALTQEQPKEQPEADALTQEQPKEQPEADALEQEQPDGN